MTKPSAASIAALSIGVLGIAAPSQAAGASSPSLKPVTGVADASARPHKLPPSMIEHDIVSYVTKDLGVPPRAFKAPLFDFASIGKKEIVQGKCDPKRVPPDY